MAKHAYVTASYHEGDNQLIKVGTVIKNVPADKLEGFTASGLWREATAAEVAKADGTNPAPRKSAPKRPSRKAAEAKPATPAAPAKAPAPVEPPAPAKS